MKMPKVCGKCPFNGTVSSKMACRIMHTKDRCKKPPHLIPAKGVKS